MSHQYEPRLDPIAISKLRPTQLTVGFREVAAKRQEWRHHAARNGPEYLGHHMVPVVLGPKGRAYLVDHHHLVRALHEEKVEQVLVSVVADLSILGKLEFWSVMDQRHWIYPFDAQGIRQPSERIPKTVDALVDDPYRSLAGSLRRAGGYAKDETLYSEFLWANFLRHRIDPKDLEHSFDKAIEAALKLARGASANFLPGWCGVSQ